MLLEGDSLYVAGDDYMKYSLKLWPQAMGMELNDPHIKVREIAKDGDI